MTEEPVTNALVHWVLENRVSNVTIGRVDRGDVSVMDTIGRILPVKWKSRFYDAAIKAVGKRNI